MANSNVRSAVSRLDDYPDEFKKCRRVRHQMDDAGTFLLKGQGRARFVVFRYECLGCGMKRTDIWNRNKELVDRRYEPPTGYNFSYTKEEREAGQVVTARLLVNLRIDEALKNKSLPEFDDSE